VSLTSINGVWEVRRRVYREDASSDSDDGAGVVHVDGGCRETFGRPGMSIMLPEITTTNPAAAESEALVTLSVQPVGRQGASDHRTRNTALGDADGNFP